MNSNANRPRRLIVAMTGASGAIYGVRLLELLQRINGLETHLVISEAGILTLKQEQGLTHHDVEKLVYIVHDVRDVGASIASGSFHTDGMIIAPCSMKSLAAIAHGYADNLITRAADVVLKERRRLVLLVRETPLNLIHLRNMAAVTEAGGIIFPPLPAFYHQPQTIADIVDHTVERVLALINVSDQDAKPWAGPK
jgi:flavin prenyltransferase